MLQKLPIGIQTFSKIRNGEYIYVDKTKQIYNLINTGSIYFLSRPRRFGKSLLISTLEEIFKGNKKLFKNLYLEKTNYNWQKYPIIRIDFSGFNKDSVTNLENSLKKALSRIAEEYSLNIKENSVLEFFKSLIIELSKINKVVILIDEYDSPLIHHLGKNNKLALEIREFLKSFYTVFKTEDQYLRFVFLTGVSKFSKVGVFSGLNQLQDITMQTRFSDLTGWTQEELENNFNNYLKKISHSHNLKKQDLIEKIKHWYNGYRFSEADIKVYNPFSSLLFFSSTSFKFHWFETGTPTFLINLLKNNKNISLEEILSKKLTEEEFSSYEIDNLKPTSLLFQTGYLTIKECQITDIGNLYRLDFPNFEVKNAFSKNILQSFSELSGLTHSYLQELIEFLKNNNFFDFFRILKIFFANIPYSIQLSNEKYYQTIFYLIFSLLGIQIKTEVYTNNGRIDAVITLEKAVYIFEFKLQGSKEEALKQIKEKKYYQQYQNQNLPLYLIGVEFETEKRNIKDWAIEIKD